MNVMRTILLTLTVLAVICISLQSAEAKRCARWDYSCRLAKVNRRRARKGKPSLTRLRNHRNRRRRLMKVPGSSVHTPQGFDQPTQGTSLCRHDDLRCLTRSANGNGQGIIGSKTNGLNNTGKNNGNFNRGGSSGNNNGGSGNGNNNRGGSNGNNNGVGNVPFPTG